MLSAAPPVVKSNSLLKFLLHFGFLISGTVTVLIGQILPILSSRLALDDAQAGDFFIAQFSGSIIGTFLTQLFVKRFGFAVVTTFGIFAMAAGLLGLNTDFRFACLAAFFVCGIGIGITLPAINMLIVELNPQAVTSALNFVNFFWGIGAIFCKPFVDFFGTATSIFAPTAILAALLLPTGLAIVFAPYEHRRAPLFGDGGEQRKPTPIWTTRAAWLTALFNFVHVGFESGIGGWITTYTERLTGAGGAGIWLSPTFSYFLFFVSGRLIAPLYARFLSENKILLASLSVMTGGVIVLIFGNAFVILVLGAAIAGFGTSAIFPTNMARFTKTFGATATRRATPLFISGTLGASIVTWAIGFVSTAASDLRTGLAVLPAACGVLIILQIYLTLKAENTPPLIKQIN